MGHLGCGGQVELVVVWGVSSSERPRAGPEHLPTPLPTPRSGFQWFWQTH